MTPSQFWALSEIIPILMRSRETWQYLPQVLSMPDGEELDRFAGALSDLHHGGLVNEATVKLLIDNPRNARSLIDGVCTFVTGSEPFYMLTLDGGAESDHRYYGPHEIPSLVLQKLAEHSRWAGKVALVARQLQRCHLLTSRNLDRVLVLRPDLDSVSNNQDESPFRYLTPDFITLLSHITVDDPQCPPARQLWRLLRLVSRAPKECLAMIKRGELSLTSDTVKTMCWYPAHALGFSHGVYHLNLVIDRLKRVEMPSARIKIIYIPLLHQKNYLPYAWELAQGLTSLAMSQIDTNINVNLLCAHAKYADKIGQGLASLHCAASGSNAIKAQLQNCINMMFAHKAHANRIAAGFITLYEIVAAFPHMQTQLQDHIAVLKKNAQYALDFSMVVKVLRESNMFTESNILLLLEHITQMSQLSDAIDALKKQVEHSVLSQNQLTQLLNTIPHATRIVNAIIELEKAHLLDDFASRVLRLYPTQAEGIATGLIALNKANIRTPENMNALLEEPDKINAFGNGLGALHAGTGLPAALVQRAVIILRAHKQHALPLGQGLNLIYRHFTRNNDHDTGVLQLVVNTLIEHAKYAAGLARVLICLHGRNMLSSIRIVTLGQDAQYAQSLFNILNALQPSEYLTSINLDKIMHYIARFQNNYAEVIEDNNKALQALASALKALVNANQLTQPIFDEIMTYPEKAILIAYRYGGKPQVGDPLPTVALTMVGAVRELALYSRNNPRVFHADMALCNILPFLCSDRDKLDINTQKALINHAWGKPTLRIEAGEVEEDDKTVTVDTQKQTVVALGVS